MAWRIDESVIRGEIDNRVRDRVTGRIWFAGLTEPVELDLAGNAWRDLAGRRLEFVNPVSLPKPLGAEELKRFARRQHGTIGDCTASRKVKVPEISMEELMERYKTKQPFPWHWGNSLYLEWVSEANGRVVIESAGYTLTVSPDIAWDMTPAEEETQRRANAAAMDGFMQRLGGADGPAVAEGPAWNDRAPQSEAEAEKMQEESDLLADRINARIEREGPNADYEKILDEELERRRRERGEAPLTPEQEAERDEWLEEANRAAEEAMKHPDPEADAELDRKHPLAEQAFDLSVRLMQEPQARGWVPDDATEEHPLIELGGSTMKAGAKFAGALDGEDWPPPVEFCAATIVRLKRAREFLDDALRAVEMCTQQALGEPAWVDGVRRELTAMAHACDALIAELRARLERGHD
ncbi:MAG: hypothetical protein NTV51_28855 [Verrucomicrobia bacterium]|nr:hypothetical protein [Verrucomicrobiota bacterium]